MVPVADLFARVDVDSDGHDGYLSNSDARAARYRPYQVRLAHSGGHGPGQ